VERFRQAVTAEARLRDLLGDDWRIDIGVCADADADRAAFSFPNGCLVPPSGVALLLTARLLCAKHGIVLSRPSDARIAESAFKPVVRQNLCGTRLLRDLADRDGRFELVVTPVGHGKIKSLTQCDVCRGRAVLASEHSGHYFYPDFFGCDSGVLTTLHMLAIAAEAKAEGEDVGEALSRLERLVPNQYVASGEVSYRFGDRDAVMDALEKANERFGGAGGIRYQIEEDADLGHDVVRPSDASYAPREGQPSPPDLKIEMEHRNRPWSLVLRPSGNEAVLRLHVETWGRTPRREDLIACMAEVEQVVIDAGGHRAEGCMGHSS
jgi:phosphomannomutase